MFLLRLFRRFRRLSGFSFTQRAGLSPHFVLHSRSLLKRRAAEVLQLLACFNKQGAGDLYAVLKIVMPPSNDEQARKLWAELASHTSFDPRSKWSK